MNQEFVKYHGHGNDFIIIDSRSLKRELRAEDIQHICTRRYGVGGDGLMLVLPSDTHTFEMEYYNADGYKGSMCGNGGRCIAHYAVQLGLAPQNETFSFLAHGDEYTAKVNVNRVDLHFPNIPESLIKNYSEQSGYVFTGSPHHIECVHDLAHHPVGEEGAEIRHSELYHPNGTNVNFIEITSPNSLNIRTFERGVEQETHACGTGTVASVLWSHHHGLIKDNSAQVTATGGLLEVQFEYQDQLYTHIIYSGDVAHVYSGHIELISC